MIAQGGATGRLPFRTTASGRAEATTIAPAGRATTRECAVCGERRARFGYRGVVKADRRHTRCFRCYRAEMDRQRWGRRHLLTGPVHRSQGRLEAVQRRLDWYRRQAQIRARKALDAADAAAASPLESTPICA